MRHSLHQPVHRHPVPLIGADITSFMFNGAHIGGTFIDHITIAEWSLSDHAIGAVIVLSTFIVARTTIAVIKCGTTSGKSLDAQSVRRRHGALPDRWRRRCPGHVNRYPRNK